MTLEQEQHSLQPFLDRAQLGEIATVAEIQHAFEAWIAHAVDESTISHFLERHGWRNLMPRPQHPQARKEAHEPFKKLYTAG